MEFFFRSAEAKSADPTRCCIADAAASHRDDTHSEQVCRISPAASRCRPTARSANGWLHLQAGVAGIRARCSPAR
ncbi:hypothetical protein [Xanthomonas sp. 1678]|uniref:hypothetical protein n=1 Tax=Xanthomonas sp. 1678 TaxID=3158788 RepID=UPI00285F5DB0|nr:hypothetical protein [Xanthomonas translucens]